MKNPRPEVGGFDLVEQTRIKELTDSGSRGRS